MRQKVILGITLLASAAMTMPTLAQAGGEGGRRGGDRPQRQPQLTPEQSETAWSLQALSVATSLGLGDDQAILLTSTYGESRSNHAKAANEFRQQLIQEMRDAAGEGRGGAGGDRPTRRGGGDGAGSDRPTRRGGDGAGGDRPTRRGGDGARGDRPARGGQREAAFGTELRQKMEDFNSKHRQGLRDEVAVFLDAGQTEDAMASLGTFNNGWDRMVNTLAGFGLGETEQFLAVAATKDYTTTMGALRQNAGQDSRRAANETARKAMMASLAEVLTPEQITEFERSLGPLGRQGGAGGPGGQGGQRGDVTERFKQMDANGDGKITKDEMPERMQQFFDRMDQNGDGVISEEEIGSLAQRRGGGAGGPGGRGGGGAGGRGGDGGGPGGRRGGGGGRGGDGGGGGGN